MPNAFEPVRKADQHWKPGMLSTTQHIYVETSAKIQQ